MGAVGNLKSVYFTDGTGYAVGGWGYPWSGGWSIALKTTNGGYTWSTVYNGESDCSAFCVSFTNPDTGYFVSRYSWAWGSTNWIEKTTDGGGTWTQYYITVGSYNVICDVHFLDLNTGYAVGCTGYPLYNGLIQKTSDGGISWSPQYIDSTSFRSVHFPSSNIGYIVGDNGIIVKTFDSGTTWSNQISGINNDLTAVYFVDENTGYVVGKSGTILKTTNGGGFAGVNNQSSNSNPLRVYPNPSSDKINISTSTKGHLSILNLNGQQLLQQEIKDSKTTIDICTLPSGVYMLKLVGKKGMQIGKIIKQ
jgi:photosystem II stability/assembly factor-like uncharacterized protein